ncbi:D-alanyl-lipoteichoic acid biosynthesis protein DltD [Lacticaseibacillus sp. GG6-2]
MKRRLLMIFGPVVLAALLVAALLSIPLPHSRFSKATVQEGAVSMAPNVLLGQSIKQQAFAGNYVPFMGSSELSRMDAFHPSVLAAKYHRDYRPFLLGAPGTQSLTQYLDDQSFIRQYRGRKLVFIISPQWFTPAGDNRNAFDYFYSPQQAIIFLYHAKPQRVADRYAAKRMLQLAPTKPFSDVHQGLLDIAAGQPLGHGLRTRLRWQQTLLHNEDVLFSRFSVRHRYRRIQAGERLLPQHATNQQLDTLAASVGKKATTNNDLGIDNHFFKQRLGGNKLAKMRGKQANFDYRRSPEYNDFELLLMQFAQNHIQVQFIIPPINQKWAHYTGLREPMVAQTTAKLRQQLKSQGFTHVLDLSRAGSRPYFMEDTIHLGWRGWVAVDRTVNPFLTQPQAAPHYHINPYYLHKAWANAPQ